MIREKFEAGNHPRNHSRTLKHTQFYVQFYIYIILYIYHTHICIYLCLRTQCAPAPVSARPLSYPSPSRPSRKSIRRRPGQQQSTSNSSDLHPLFDEREQGAVRAAEQRRPTLLHIPQSIPNQRHYAIENRGRKGEGKREGKVDRR